MRGSPHLWGAEVEVSRGQSNAAVGLLLMLDCGGIKKSEVEILRCCRRRNHEPKTRTVHPGDIARAIRANE